MIDRRRAQCEIQPGCSAPRPQTAPDPAAQFRLREVLQNELGLEDASKIAIGAVETVLGAEAY